MANEPTLKLDLDKYRDDWRAAQNPERAFYLDRPAMFSSAAAAQDAGNRSRMLWCWAPIYLPWEYTNWLEEGRSFHDTAYIGDWSGTVKLRFQGPDALAFLSETGTNDLSKFPLDQAKHYVQVNGAGKLASQGVLYRLGEEDFLFTGNSAFWSSHMLENGRWDAHATIESADHFVFSVQGPRSKEIVETAANSKLDALRFNRFVTLQIGGVDVRVMRTGITGELGYELHGSTEVGNHVWSTIVSVGEAYGIKQLGARSQMISHVEAGIATNDRDFVSAAIGTPGAPLIPPSARANPRGSYDLSDLSVMFRSPAEVGWYRQVSLETHDFIGRDALKAQQEAGGPANRLVGLVWEPKDILAAHATLFGDGPLVPPMDLPRLMGLSVDQVMSRGEMVGCSTSRVYSPFLRKMISLGYLPNHLAEVGNQVSVIWGDRGGPQQEIRASVVALPFKEDVRRQALG